MKDIVKCSIIHRQSSICNQPIRMNRFLLLNLAVLALFSCQREPKLPNTPEEVVRQYQAYYDKNLFEEAKALSTPAERQRLDDLKSIIESEPADSTIFTTTFISIQCQAQQDTAVCLCEVKDIEEPYTTEYKLVRINGQWLIDAPEEEIEIEEDFMELDSLEIDSFLHRDTLEHEQ